MHKCRNISFNAITQRIFSGFVMVGLLLALLSSTTHARGFPGGRVALVPEAWTPSLSQLKTTLEASASSESQGSQQALNINSQNLADVGDAQLFIVYIHLLQRLNLPERNKLFREQQRWLTKRAALAKASVTSQGGSLAPLEYSATFIKITEERLAELQKRLPQPRKHSATKK